jgi:hypothetical protein
MCLRARVCFRACVCMRVCARLPPCVYTCLRARASFHVCTCSLPVCVRVSVYDHVHARVCLCALCVRCSLAKLSGGVWGTTMMNFLKQIRVDYPSPIKIFLGCGPMSETYQYCPTLQGIVAKWNADGDSRVYLLDFRIPGMLMKGCLGHPNWYGIGHTLCRVRHSALVVWLSARVFARLFVCSCVCVRVCVRVCACVCVLGQ